MNCAICKANKIGPNSAPFGGYLCKNEHLQCRECNAQAAGQCVVCEGDTSFVQMNYNFAGPLPSAPPAELSHATITDKNNIPEAARSNAFKAQSSLSQEQLSIHDDLEVVEPPPAEPKRLESYSKAKDAAGEPTLMQTIFIATNQRQQSASNLDFKLATKQHKSSHKQQQLSHTRNFLDLDEPSIIHTSEIRFMDSTESLQNYYSGGTLYPPLVIKIKADEVIAHANVDAPAERTDYQRLGGGGGQLEVLNTGTLCTFERANTAKPGELVEHYLRNYGPCSFPYGSQQHSDCYGNHSGHCHSWALAPPLPALVMRSVCTSTESEPMLLDNKAVASKQPAPPAMAAAKHLPAEYFVMQATGVTRPPVVPAAETAGIKGTHSIETYVRMQRVLETFQEEPRQAAPPLESAENFKMSPVTEELLPVPSCMESVPEESVAKMPRISRLFNAHRAYYQPSGSALRPVLETSAHLLSPQFQLITCSTLVADELAQLRERYQLDTPISAKQLQILRCPIRCPESNCHRQIFVSDINKHLIVDHSNLPMERIATRQCKGFFLDPRLSHRGISKCHMLYLIKDKIRDLGSNKFKDLQPLLVMSTRLKLSDLCGLPPLNTSDVDFLMIWLTGIVPDEIPVSATLAVWSRAGPISASHMVHSGEIYSIRKSSNHANIYRSGLRLLLSAEEVYRLTDGGKEMLEFQLLVH